MSKFIMTSDDVTVTGLINMLEKNDVIPILDMGVPKGMLVSVEEFQRLQDADLRDSVAQAKVDVANGNYVAEAATEHVNRVTDMFLNLV